MIGIICAMAIEVDGLSAQMTNKKTQTFAKMKFTSGILCQRKVVLTECGIGKVNAAMSAQVMIDRYSPKCIINSGIAGSVSNTLNIGDIVVSKDCVQHDYDGTQMGDPPGLIWYNDEQRIDIPADKNIADKLVNACKKLPDTKVVLGRIATGDVFVAQHSGRVKIADVFSASACEMEGGAVGQVCYRNEVPFAVLRCISDDFNESRFMDYMEFRELAAKKSISAIKNFLELV